MTRKNPEFDRCREPKQARGRATLDALIHAGRSLVEVKGFDELTVGEISAAAGCSVGSFYLRFKDKDAFLRALIADMQMEKESLEINDNAGLPVDAIEVVVHELVARYRRSRGLIRAAIKTSMVDSSIWEPIKRHGYIRADLLIRHLGPEFNEQHIRFALQVLYGTLNNTILLSPGPLNLDDESYETELLRAFKLVLQLD